METWGRWTWLFWGMEGLSQSLGWIFVVYIAVVVTLYLSLHGETLYDRVWRWREIPAKPKGKITTHRSLLVIAHPDDEVMFFGPTIMGLLRKGNVYVLCLSIGDFEKKGYERKKELYDSCRLLGIKSEHVTILNHEKMKDGPRRRWPVDHIANVVSQHVLSHDISTLVTFDSFGVSGHVNHISICKAVMYLQDRNAIPECRVFVLDSVNIIRKYIVGLLDLPISYLSKRFLFVNTGKNRSVISSAMESHESQLVWFRRIYMVFSRYVIINSLQEIIPFAETTRLANKRKKLD